MKILFSIIGLILFLAIFVLFWFTGRQLPEQIVRQMDQAGIVLGYLATCLTITLGFIAWFRRQDIRQWFSRIRFRNVGAPFDVPANKVVCAVIPVSPRPNQPEWILRWLKPQYVSFLYTNASRDMAVRLAEQFSQPPHRIQFFPDAAAMKADTYELHDADAPEESKSLVSMFLRRFLDHGTPKDEIYVDTTAGKVPMSIGAFQTAEEFGVSSIYIVGTVNGYIKDPVKREHGRPVFISNRTLGE